MNKDIQGINEAYGSTRYRTFEEDIVNTFQSPGKEARAIQLLYECTTQKLFDLEEFSRILKRLVRIG